MTSLAAHRAHFVALTSLLALIALCVAWEWLLAPARPGGSWLALKALPLLLPLPGLLRATPQRRYTYQWTTLFIWLYFTEGVVRAWSDLTAVSRSLAGLEIALCIVFFAAAISYVRATPSHLARA
jgi:uncharacterized membrane protein